MIITASSAYSNEIDGNVTLYSCFLHQYFLHRRNRSDQRIKVVHLDASRANRGYACAVPLRTLPIIRDNRR